MVQFASYLRRVLCKTRLIFPRINGPNVPIYLLGDMNCRLESSDNPEAKMSLTKFLLNGLQNPTTGG